MHRNYYIRLGYEYVDTLINFCRKYYVREVLVSSGWVGYHAGTYMYQIDNIDKETLVALKLTHYLLTF